MRHGRAAHSSRHEMTYSAINLASICATLCFALRRRPIEAQANVQYAERHAARVRSASPMLQRAVWLRRVCAGAGGGGVAVRGGGTPHASVAATRDPPEEPEKAASVWRPEEHAMRCDAMRCDAMPQSVRAQSSRQTQRPRAPTLRVCELSSALRWRLPLVGLV